MKRSHVLASGLLSVALVAMSVPGAHAAESSASHYMPGFLGQGGFAFAPERGLNMRDVTLWHQGDIDKTVLPGGVAYDASTESYMNVIEATYGLDYSIFGGQYSVGIRVPFGYVSVKGKTQRGDGTWKRFDDDKFGLGDIELVPLQLNWQRGNFHLEVSQSIIAPTGAFDDDDMANVGLGHWSFDTIGAVTWHNQSTGTEVSFALGLMHNAENTRTKYHSGNETHTDIAINQYLTDDFAIGIRSYRLNQLHRDTGKGAKLGPLEGFSQGIGAGITWTPELSSGDFSFSASYMRDYENRDGRYDAEYAQFSVVWTF